MTVMDSPFTLETRLPKLGVLTPGTHQQIRRLRRKRTLCYRCGIVMAPGRNVLFDDGHDAHADCSIERNADIRRMRRVFASQDARDSGRTAPWELATPMQVMKREMPFSSSPPLIRQAA